MSTLGIPKSRPSVRFGAVLTALVCTAVALAQASSPSSLASPPGTNQTSGAVIERPIPRDAITPPVPIETRAVWGGALPAVARSPQPLQMINPLAPARYGDGTQYLATNPMTGTAEGVTLLSIKFPSKPPKAKKTGYRTKPR